MDGWEGLKAKKKTSLKVNNLKKFFAALRAAKFFNIFSTALHALQQGLCTSSLLPTPMIMKWFVHVSLIQILGSAIIEGSHSCCAVTIQELMKDDIPD